MRIIRYIVLTLIFASHCVYAEPASIDTDAKVKQTITKFMQDNHIPGVAVVLYDNGNPHTYYFGVANKTKKTPINNKTIFEVGSLTKLMTSFLFAQEIDVAKVSLNDSVRKYDKTLPETFDKITLMQLATHTASLPFNTTEDIKTQADLNTFLSEWEPDTTPGSEYNYSNIGIGLLGKALEAETKQDYTKLYTAHLAKPLKMQAFTFSVPTRYKKNIAQGYDKAGKPTAPVNSPFFPEAAALKISVEDMQKFLAAAIGLPGTPDSILYPMRMSEAAHVRLPEQLQGLGWRIYPISTDTIDELLDEPEEMNRGPMQVLEIYSKAKYDGNALIDKTGGTDGFRSYIALIPNKKSGIVILTNQFVTNDEIVEAGRDILFSVTKLTNDEVA